MIKKILACGAALALASSLASPAAAQNTLGAQNGGSSSTSQIIPNFDTDNLIPILEEMGLEWRGVSVPGQNGTNKNVLLARASNGITFALEPTACRQGVNSGCIGLSLVAGFDGNAPQSAVNSFNYRYHFVSAGLDPSGAAFLTRYDIADFGTVRGNVISSIYNFASISGTFREALNGSKQTVSLDSFATDMEASSLNRQALVAAGIQVEDANKALNGHVAGFERAGELMKVLVKADEKAPGKILNTIGK